MHGFFLYIRRNIKRISRVLEHKSEINIEANFTF